MDGREVCVSDDLDISSMAISEDCTEGYKVEGELDDVILCARSGSPPPLSLRKQQDMTCRSGSPPPSSLRQKSVEQDDVTPPEPEGGAGRKRAVLKSTPSITVNPCADNPELESPRDTDVLILDSPHSDTEFLQDPQREGSSWSLGSGVSTMSMTDLVSNRRQHALTPPPRLISFRSEGSIDSVQEIRLMGDKKPGISRKGIDRSSSLGVFPVQEEEGSSGDGKAKFKLASLDLHHLKPRRKENK